MKKKTLKKNKRGTGADKVKIIYARRTFKEVDLNYGNTDEMEM